MQLSIPRTATRLTRIACVILTAWVLSLSMAIDQARASVPPSTWKPATWTGPGRICAQGFEFILAEGETATQGWPSIGRIPYTVRTARGMFVIDELWSTAETFPVRRWLEARPSGSLFALPPDLHVTDSQAIAQFVFLPDGFPQQTRPLPVAAVFFAAMQSTPGDWSQADYDNILRRLSFGLFQEAACLPPNAS